MTVCTRTSQSGNKLEQIFISGERYAFDFSDEYRNNWIQYDTDQDDWYYGVWYNPAKMQTLSYAEGDIYLVTCDNWDAFINEMQDLDSFHGSPPPAWITADGITASGLTNCKAYTDPNARMTPGMQQPEPLTPITIDDVATIFIN